MNNKQVLNKRQRIINGAIAVFSRKGFYKATIEEIAEQADVGKGTVYEYFSSKKELFQEMFLYTEEKYEEMFHRGLSDAVMFQDKLQKMFQITMRFLNCHKEMAQILLAGYPPVAEDIQKVLIGKNQQNITKISKILEESITRKEIRPVDTGAAAKVILGTLFFVGGQVLFSEDEKESGFNLLAQNVVDIILQGLLLT